jgi:hypothetical protein
MRRFGTARRAARSWRGSGRAPAAIRRVASFRFGWTRFPDNQPLTAPFDPATLGFNSKFIGLIPSDPNARKFPGGDMVGRQPRFVFECFEIPRDVCFEGACCRNQPLALQQSARVGLPSRHFAERGPLSAPQKPHTPWGRSRAPLSVTSALTLPRSS